MIFLRKKIDFLNTPSVTGGARARGRRRDPRRPCRTKPCGSAPEKFREKFRWNLRSGWDGRNDGIDSTRAGAWDLRTPPTVSFTNSNRRERVALRFLESSLSFGRSRSYLAEGECSGTPRTPSQPPSKFNGFFHGRRTRVGREVVEEVHRADRADLKIQRACVCFSRPCGENTVKFNIFSCGNVYNFAPLPRLEARECHGETPRDVVLARGHLRKKNAAKWQRKIVFFVKVSHFSDGNCRNTYPLGRRRGLVFHSF